MRGAKAARASPDVIGIAIGNLLCASPLRGGRIGRSTALPSGELRQRIVALRRRRQRLIALRRRELLRRARPAKLGLESTELLGHELELAGQSPKLRLDRIDPGGETGGIAETLACIAGGIFLRQRHTRLCLHERFERGHHGLEIGDLLLDPPDSIRRCGGRGRRRGLSRRCLLWFGLGRSLLGESRGSAKEEQKRRFRQ